MIVRERKYKTDFDPAAFAREPNAFARYWLVAYCVLVGGSERFIIRSCAPFLAKARPSLRAELKLCFGQEANHARTHDAFLAEVVAKVPGLGAFVRWNELICFRLLERISPAHLRLAAAAAMEQLNTCIAMEGIRAAPIAFEEGALGRMLHWHYVEEIEHREVVFDLMAEMRIGMPLRVAAMALVYVSFALWISAGAVLAAWPHRGGFRGILGFLWGEAAILQKMLGSAWSFCRLGYHPRQDPLPQGFALLAQRV